MPNFNKSREALKAFREHVSPPETPPPKSKKKMGRPNVDINWELIAECAHIQCTIAEICAVAKVDYETLQSRCLKDHGMSFSNFYTQKREGGKKSLRRAQWHAACETENTALLIWAGKQYLGQSDKIENTNTNTTTVNLSDTELAAKMLALIDTLTKRAAAAGEGG